MPSNKYLPTNKVSVDFYLKYNCREQSPEISDGEGRTETQPETVAWEPMHSTMRWGWLFLVIFHNCWFCCFRRHSETTSDPWTWTNDEERVRKLHFCPKLFLLFLLLYLACKIFSYLLKSSIFRQILKMSKKHLKSRYYAVQNPMERWELANGMQFF